MPRFSGFSLDGAIDLMRALFAVVAVVAQVATTSAPGDLYFGKLHMSALRIRYETMQLKKRYETHALAPEQAEHLLLLTEDAYRDWARRYPHDPWLASTGFSLAQLYGELPGGTARSHAAALLLYVKSHFPKTTYARRASAQLHNGIPLKPYPSWASAMRTLAPSSTPIVPASAQPSPPAAAPQSPRASPSPRSTTR